MLATQLCSRKRRSYSQVVNYYVTVHAANWLATSAVISFRERLRCKPCPTHSLTHQATVPSRQRCNTVRQECASQRDNSQTTNVQQCKHDCGVTTYIHVDAVKDEGH